MLRVSVVLLSALCVAYAAQSIGPLHPKPAKFMSVAIATTEIGKLPGCYIKELDQVIPIGQAAPDRNSCMEYRCGQTFITYTTCGAVSAQPPLEVFEDKTKLYPDCCPKIRRNPRKTRW